MTAIGDPQAIAAALGGRWKASGAMVRCPAHKDSSPSLSIGQMKDGRLLVHCFAGCSQASVIAELQRLKLWPNERPEADPSAPHRLTTRADGLDIVERRRRAWAHEIWAAAVPVNGTIAEAYLRGRGIIGRLPECLRYAPALKHPSGYEIPALVGALRTGLGEFTAIQRIFLERDGGKAKVEPRKLTLGPMLDGACRLGAPRDVLGLAEGIETALSAAAMFKVPCWASLGAGRLAKVRIPDGVEQVWIFADSGGPGMREARRAADHFELAGLTAIVRPPDEPFGDHNDWLMAGAPAGALA